MTFNIFISYSQDDFLAHGMKIRNYLAKVIHDSYVYIDQIKPKGEKWREKNDSELLNADLVVLIITPAVLNSDEVKREIKLAHDKNITILPCKHEDLQMDWKVLPLELGEIEGIRFEDDEVLKTRLFREITNIIKTSKPPKKLQKPVQFVGMVYVVAGKETFGIKYGHEIGDLQIHSAEIDKLASSIIFNSSSKSNTEITIELPRTLIDAKVGNEDAMFYVLCNGEEIAYEEIKGESVRSFVFTCPEKTETIEIIGRQILGISYGTSSKEENVVKLVEGASVPDAKYAEPENLKIKVGSTVRWDNEDTAAHTVTSGTPKTGTDGIFDSSLFMSGTSFSVTFEKKGIYNYFCMVHPWKVCKIEVE